MEKVDVVLWGRHATVEWETDQGGAVVILSIPDKLQHKVQGQICFRLFRAKKTRKSVELVASQNDLVIVPYEGRITELVPGERFSLMYNRIRIAAWLVEKSGALKLLFQKGEKK